MSLFGWLKRRRPDEEDFQEEIRSHLEIAADERVADGDDRHSARLSSLKEFGNVTLTTEAARSVWVPRWVDALRDLMLDVRHAVRVLVKNPGFSLTVFVVLTLGIGLNATVFTLLKSIALSPVAGVDRSASLAVVLNQTSAGRQATLSYPDFQYLRDHDRAFVGLIGSRNVNVSLGSGTRAETIFGEMVTGNYFQELGVRAQLGRTLLPSDEVAPGQHPVVVLSDALWKRYFGGDPDIVGKTIKLNAYPLTVVGVAAPSFHGTIVSFDVEVFVPVMMTPQVVRSGTIDPQKALSDTQANMVIAMGRLRPGISRSEASAQMAVLSAQLRRDRDIDAVAHQLTVVPFWRSPFGAQTYMLPAVIVLSAMGALLLLIVCANITALVLARGLSRRGEIALRLALGASRVRILRLLLVENIVLAAPAALVALALVPLLMRAMQDAMGDVVPIPLFFNLSVDRLVIAFSVAAACASALVFGLFPALTELRRGSPVGDEGRFLASLRGARTLSHGSRRLAGGGLAAAARHGRPGRAKSRRVAERRSGIRRHRCGLDENRRHAEWIRRDESSRVLQGSAGPPARRPWHRVGDVGDEPAADARRFRSAEGDDRRLRAPPVTRTWRFSRTSLLPTTSVRCTSGSLPAASSRTATMRRRCRSRS